MLKWLSFLCILPLVLSTGAAAQTTNEAGPSFSCTGRVLFPTEAVICLDDELMTLDRLLASVYRNKFINLSSGRQTELEALEQIWIAGRNRCGTNKPCISEAYQARISLLGGSLPSLANTNPQIE